MLDKMWETPTQKEDEDEEYRLMVRKFQHEEMSGRSLVTGY
jgi:hypothetical protein